MEMLLTQFFFKTQKNVLYRYNTNTGLKKDINILIILVQRNNTTQHNTFIHYFNAKKN